MFDVDPNNTHNISFKSPVDTLKQVFYITRRWN